jgi:hypothetical protein
MNGTFQNILPNSQVAVKYTRCDIQEEITSARYIVCDMRRLPLVSDGAVLPSVFCSGSASAN